MEGGTIHDDADEMGFTVNKRSSCYMKSNRNENLVSPLIYAYTFSKCKKNKNAEIVEYSK